MSSGIFLSDFQIDGCTCITPQFLWDFINKEVQIKFTCGGSRKFLILEIPPHFDLGVRSNTPYTIPRLPCVLHGS